MVSGQQLVVSQINVIVGDGEWHYVAASDHNKTGNEEHAWQVMNVGDKLTQITLQVVKVN